MIVARSPFIGGLTGHFLSAQGAHMAGTTWTKFFWSDWLSDIGLRRCSIAARGIWMDMLCVAAQQQPIGYVPLNAAEIGRVCGVTEPEAQQLIGELERNGVFSRTRNGTIYSRRMISEARKLADAKKFGQQGGHPKLKGGYTEPGFLYLVGVREDGAYKLGISKNPHGRLKKLKQQYPSQNLRVLDSWSVPNMGEAETRTQHLIRGVKREGEWFFLSDVNIENIKTFCRTLKGDVKAGLNGGVPPRVQSPLSQEPDLYSFPTSSRRTTHHSEPEKVGGRLEIEKFKPDPSWVAVCTQIVQAYEHANIASIPDTNLVWVWKELGFKRELILAICKTEIAKFNGKFKPLQYLQPIIERAHALRTEIKDAVIEKPIAWDTPLKHFKETGQWMLRDTPAPGQPGCKAPMDKLIEYNLVSRETALN